MTEFPTRIRVTMVASERVVRSVAFMLSRELAMTADSVAKLDLE